MNQAELDRVEFADRYAGLLHLWDGDPGFERAASSYHRAVSVTPRIERVTMALDLYRAALETEDVKAHFILLMLVVDRLFSPGLRGRVLVHGLREKIGKLLGEPAPEWVTQDYRSRNGMLYGSSRGVQIDVPKMRDELCPRWRSLLRKLLREILVKEQVRLFLNTTSLKKI
jgi:hypothetical protein